MSLTLWETPKTGFVATMPKLLLSFILLICLVHKPLSAYYVCPMFHVCKFTQFYFSMGAKNMSPDSTGGGLVTALIVPTRLKICHESKEYET